jgi:hypothetical protein
MRLFTAIALLFILSGCGMGEAIVSRIPKPTFVNPGSCLPKEGEIEGLHALAKPRHYKGDAMIDPLGKQATMFARYGAKSLSAGDYYLQIPERTVTIEDYEMDDDVAAAGIFHFYRGRKLGQDGVPVDAGTQGVCDAGRERRNLYFYKQSHFVKLIYSGKDPVPDLATLARAVSAKLPGGKEPPKGFSYLEVPGVDPSTARVTAGYTFNCDFLPTGIFAKAPGAGDISEVFLIGHLDEKDAQETGNNYRTYLEINGKDYTIKGSRRGRVIWWARDPDQGRVICTVYRKFLIGVLRPQTYDKGEAMLALIVNKMGQEE